MAQEPACPSLPPRSLLFEIGSNKCSRMMARHDLLGGERQLQIKQRRLCDQWNPTLLCPVLSLRDPALLLQDHGEPRFTAVTRAPSSYPISYHTSLFSSHQARSDQSNYLLAPPGWELWGSNNASTWSLLDEESDVSWTSAGETQVRDEARWGGLRATRHQSHRWKGFGSP